MPSKLVTATEAARNFSDVLDRVSHHGTSYDIRRGREVIARLVPAQPVPRTLTVVELAALLARVPSLEPGDSERFEKDVAVARKRLRPPRDLWR